MDSGAFSSKAKTWWLKADDIRMELEGLATWECMIQYLFYELPQSVGHVADAKQDVVKLSIMAGMLAGCGGFECSPVPVSIPEWKGQLKKSMLKPRIDRILKRRNYRYKTDTTHEMDAIGIGLYILGEI